MEIITEKNKYQQNIISIEFEDKVINRKVLDFLLKNRFLVKVKLIDYKNKDIENLKNLKDKLEIINLNELKKEIKSIIGSYVQMGLCAPISNFRNNKIDKDILEYIKYLIIIYNNIGEKEGIDYNVTNVMLHGTDSVEKFMQRYFN